MTLIGMSKETYLKILDEVIEIRYLIALSDTSNNWPTIEKILRERHNLSSDYARMFTKLSSGGDFQLESNGPVWIADRPEPKLENYPEVAEFLEEK